MQEITLNNSAKKIKQTIHLTGSKSECNRALILKSLSNNLIVIENMSAAADTVTLKNILQQFEGLRSPCTEQVIDVGPAGTAMRFLTAYFAISGKKILLTGSARMKQRPIGILVEALRQLGAEIDFTEVDDYPPLRFKGGFEQKTNKLSIKGNVSSQYITSLLLIANTLPLGLELHIEDELTSKPYVEMTLAMLEQCGINHSWKENVITIKNQVFKEALLTIEPDWSAASYWYAFAALADEAEIHLPNLQKYSLQGDSKISEIMANFGITTVFEKGRITLTKENKKLERKIFDMKECPDLAQTVIVCCAALGHNATFTGLETLKIKETDRVLALQTELAKIGVKLIEKNATYKLDCSNLSFPNHLHIKTYEDHRMAMAFAPLLMKVKSISFDDEQVVAKSYPDFWKDVIRVVNFKL